MGFMQSQSLDISEIMTETSTEPSPILIEEDNITRGTSRTKRKEIYYIPSRHRSASKNRTTRC